MRERGGAEVQRVDVCYFALTPQLSSARLSLCFNSLFFSILIRFTRQQGFGRLGAPGSSRRNSFSRRNFGAAARDEKSGKRTRKMTGEQDGKRRGRGKLGRVNF